MVFPEEAAGKLRKSKRNVFHNLGFNYLDGYQVPSWCPAKLITPGEKRSLTRPWHGQLTQVI